MSTVKKASKNQRRFNEDQIKTLETLFQSESRPELRLKQHLADKLGLQPRQVAIWFQNKRARSKSKEIERDYSMLKADYDKLAAQFDTLKKENQALLVQLQTLRNMVDKRESVELAAENRLTLEDSENTQFLLEINSHDEQFMPPCTDLNRKVEYLQETDTTNMPLIDEGPLPSVENGCGFEACTFLENAGKNTLWWDF